MNTSRPRDTTTDATAPGRDGRSAGGGAVGALRLAGGLLVVASLLGMVAYSAVDTGPRTAAAVVGPGLVGLALMVLAHLLRRPLT